MIIATAGHIDHGKTTLVKALTGVDTDRLPEEKARGISIDLGFAYWKAPQGDAVLGFVDVPGHERFVRNMLAGVCGVDYVILIVAADDGIKPQTIEHLNIVDLLGLSRGIAVVTKIDRVPQARVEEVAQSVKTLLAPTSLANAAVLPISATGGQGMDELRRTLAAAAAAHGARAREGRHFRFAIDRVFTVAGSGTVVTGTVFDGATRTGDKLILSPSGIEVRVRGIQKDGRKADDAFAGERCALNLSGAERSQAARGDWAVHPFLHAPTQRMDVRIRVLGSEAQALKHWTPVHVHLGAQDMLGRVALRRGAAIEPGSSGIAQLILEQPIAALTGDRFIVRDQSALRTVGGGTIIDAFAPRRRSSAEGRAARLDAMERPEPLGILQALLLAQPGGVDLEHFARSLNIVPASADALAKQAGMVVLGKERPVGLARATVDAAKAAIIERLKAFHAQSPQESGMDVAGLRKVCAPALAPETFGFVLRLLSEDKQIELGGSTARLPRHVATSNPADEATWQKVRPELEGAAIQGLTIAELALAAKVKEGVLKDFLYRKAATGEIVRVTAERFYLRATVDSFAAAAQAVAQAAPGGKFTAAQYRDRIGLGRTRAIEILECLDRLRITQRIGDVRVYRK